MTLPTSTPNWFDSSEVGAPTLNNAAGSLLDVLRACLIDGFGSQSVTSIVVSSEVATVNCTAHGFSDAYGKLVLIEGASQSSLNGRKRIGNVLTDSFTYPAPGVANGTYTGTISAKRAPLGWAEPHTGTNVAIFARTAPEATAMLLRVDDSHVSPSTATDARILMVESATDVDTLVDISPTAVQDSGGTRWFKGANNAAAKPWAIFGDDRFFYFVMPGVNGVISTFSYVIGAFGDIEPTVTPDAYRCLLAGSFQSITSGSVNYPLPRTNTTITSTDSSMVLARAANQTGRSARVATAAIGAGNTVMGANGSGQTDIANVQIATGALLVEETSFFLRGRLPGLYWPLARAPFQGLPQFAVIDSVIGSDRRLVNVLCRSGNVDGNCLIDVEGPWR